MDESEVLASSSDASISTNIQLLPTEIRLSILSHLEVKEIKQFSQCSKICRTTCLPILYRRLNLSYVRGSRANCNVTPTSRLDQIRAAFVEPEGNLYNLHGTVRHVTIDTEDLAGFDNIVTYYRALVSMLPLFPALNSLKISYFSPSASLYSPRSYSFDTRLIHGFCSTLWETCPAYRTLKSLYFGKAEYRFTDSKNLDAIRNSPLSDENEVFMGLNPGEGVLKYSTTSTIPWPPALEEAYFDVDVRSTYFPGSINTALFITSSTTTLKKFGLWLNLHMGTPRFGQPSDPFFSRDTRLPCVTDLGFCLDFLNAREYTDELKMVFPNIESLSVFVDKDSHGGFWEEEAIKSYTRLLRFWPETLKKVRLPWFTENGDFENEHARTKRINSWFEIVEDSRLEEVLLVRETPEDYFEAVDCSISGTGSVRELKWSGVHHVEKLPLDGV
ncbi:hypothetical protein TWF730_008785 [Orbilia blumenaviensis]|uniref:F-box domain-containing protein n=1 Tax=Orbilia blumenaviensis TaxID=1796055 RepID=A0AAV9V605_9PEZI